MSSSKKWSRVGLRLLFSVGVIGLLVLAAELVLRFVAPQPLSWLDIYRRHPKVDTYSLRPNVERYIDTGECRWWVMTDADGLRAPPPAMRTGTSSLCLGDSFTFGQGVSYESTFVGILQAADEPNLHFINAGVPGYGPVQYRQVLEHRLSLVPLPQVVLIATYMGNDFHDCIWKAESSRVADRILANRVDLTGRIKRWSHLYRLVSRVHHRIAPSPQNAGFRNEMYERQNWETGILKEGRAAFKREFKRMAELCHQASVPLHVMIIPTRTMVDDHRRRTGSGDMGPEGSLVVSEIMSEILTDLGIPFLDLTPHLAALPTEKTYFVHDGHLTPRGHGIVAKALLDHFVRSRDD